MYTYMTTLRMLRRLLGWGLGASMSRLEDQIRRMDYKNQLEDEIKEFNEKSRRKD